VTMPPAGTSHRNTTAAACEPYANGRGWFHTPGCEHVDWSEDQPFIDANPSRRPAGRDADGGGT